MAGPSDSGGWSPDGGFPDDLPDLPDEWGVIVIPDDLSELDDEVEAVRAELRLTRGEPTRWTVFADRPAVRRIRRISGTALRAPVLIISMAVLVTVASLFASTWPGPARQPATQRTATTTNRVDTLPALELVDSDGRPVPLRGQLPAVILFIEKCQCDGLVSDTVTAVRADIAVITVVARAAASAANTPPTGATPQAQGKTLRVLHDPADNVRQQLGIGPADDTAAVLLVDRGGDIVKMLTRTFEFGEIQPHLARI
jgi:hypothetical protein